MKYTNEEALSIIESEGIGYAVTSKCSPDNFEDPRTVELWKNAEIALRELEEYLEDFKGN